MSLAERVFTVVVSEPGEATILSDGIHIAVGATDRVVVILVNPHAPTVISNENAVIDNSDVVDSVSLYVDGSLDDEAS